MCDFEVQHIRVERRLRRRVVAGPSGRHRPRGFRQKADFGTAQVVITMKRSKYFQSTQIEKFWLSSHVADIIWCIS